MTTTIESAVPRQLIQASLKPRGRVQRSPDTWRDEILYFLLPDRFSDGRESTRSLFNRNQPQEHRAANWGDWMRAGTRFQGGTLRGILSKLDYLKGLGVTTLWIGPVWKQRADLQTYHGYGIQNFLDVDPRFGTRQDLRDVVDSAHDRGMFVVLDIIYNHTGNNWFYDQDGQPRETVGYLFQPPRPHHGWRSGSGQSTNSIQGLEDAVWPLEFQDPRWYTSAGQIGRWDPASWEDPMSPDEEFRRGDFFDLKDLNTHRPEEPVADAALSALVQVYRYWIALTDCDGFRIDTVKHVSFEASKNFCGGIREYAESIGKENFLLLGEVTGGEAFERNYLDVFGRNLDAVLDIGEPAGRLTRLAKGFENPADFFEQFDGHETLGSHRETGRYHVSILDDHDMVGREGKRRFSAGNEGPARYAQAANAVGVQLTTLGIPCVYYGTEQSFDGTEDRHDTRIEPRDGYGQIPSADRYIRESMFGGSFGAFGTEGCHFFDRDHPTYLRIAAVARLRQGDDQVGRALRRGRQYPRETSFLERPFAFSGAGELTAWSRILYNQEVLVALNTHGTEGRGALVTVDPRLHAVGTRMSYLYRSDWSDPELRQPSNGQSLTVEAGPDGRACVRIDLPAAGMAILA